MKKNCEYKLLRLWFYSSGFLSSSDEEILNAMLNNGWTIKQISGVGIDHGAAVIILFERKKHLTI